MSISTTLEIVAELRAGRMVILVDEEDRENEGDLVMAAEFVTTEAINFMTKYGRGLVCLTLTAERCDQLQLPMMTTRNGTAYGTNFTVSIEAAEGVTTGISAADRAKTIQVAVDPMSDAADIVQPGHIFPLRAQKGGVLMRAGHTEAGCDFAELAGLTPAAVICEIMNDDGSMARLPDLIEFAKQHDLKIGTIADLIHYRSLTESFVERVAERSMVTAHGTFNAIAYRDKPSGSAHLALVHGDVSADQVALVRVHQPVSVLDLLECSVTTHSWNLASAMQAIQASPNGVLVLLNCEESAEQMFAQFTALTSPKAKPQGRAASMDLRTYGIGAQILKDVGVGKMQLLASPRKMPSMTGFNLEVVGYQEKPAN
ncbi:bifunctional 3,4-dihydroxy-2-butanone-4-phosphate synthase/GTP cyclohydrolase II [Solimicrobium silvestre]|uniref:3,4-dihydroxy-2-butanone 4-phosphate synthase n=1 Tax=Solimicrobium silvestre TaxID=2099400 RepID=A0A2S9GU82_9BURK|nr:bifunctional 3,4-dihydroxy-2-butanone-4-phosphate synthase/GTP cyclohydrolase II [Solimicrobium silvestre]PRC91216.1 ribB: 3,4-dihydroxy-2-butanone-4-phosphate synthase [Solimicrobium silvestre]